MVAGAILLDTLVKKSDAETITLCDQNAKPTFSRAVGNATGKLSSVPKIRRAPNPTPISTLRFDPSSHS